MNTYLENTEIHYEMTVRAVGSSLGRNTKIESDLYGVPNPSTDEEAFYMANQILTVWNDTRDQWDEPRELVNVQRVGTKVIDLINQNPEEDSEAGLHVECISCDGKVNIEEAEEVSGKIIRELAKQEVAYDRQIALCGEEAADTVLSFWILGYKYGKEEEGKCFVECTGCEEMLDLEEADEDSGSNYFCKECYKVLAPVMRSEYEEAVRNGEIEEDN